MKHLFFYTILIFSVICTPVVWAVSDKGPPAQIQEASSFEEIKYFPNLNMTQILLKNGMTVWLKPTDFETNEVFVKLSALGGFASLSNTDRASGELAAQIAWESGMGELTTDQIYVLMYEHALEFTTKIQAFSRAIEGTSDREGLKEFLHCVNMVFTKHRLTESGLKAAVENAKRIISKMGCDSEQLYETAFQQINTEGLEVLRPLGLADLKNVNLATAQSFFDACFSDPSGFVCVIVGNFDLDEAKAWVKEYLGEISRSTPKINFDKSFTTSFPKGLTHKSITLSGRTNSITRLTFPLQPILNDKNLPSMEFMCQIIEARLRRLITSKMKISHGVDISYEFPLYPSLDRPWISIQFRSEPKNAEMIIDLILTQLKHIQDHGVTEAEMHEIKKLQTGSEEFWLRDNFYWVSMLSNYYLWKWSPEQIHQAEIQTKTLTLGEVNEMLKTYFTLNNYSIITGQP